MRVLSLALSAAAALALSTTMALAAVSTAPGTDITNSIDLSYSSGGTTINQTGAASVTFKVDRKINLNVDGLNAGNTVTAEQAATNPVLSFLVENLGNDTQGFDVNVAATGTLGLTYDPTGAGTRGTYWIKISNNATPGAGTEVLYNANGTVNAGDLAPAGKYYVHIYASVPTTAASGQATSFDVTATALNKTTNTIATELRGQGLNGVDTVFADPGLDGKEADTESLTINAPVLSASKSVAVVSENRDGTFNCATGTAVSGAEAAIPGACVEYTITVTNAAAATSAASSLVITDALPAGVTYASHSNSGFTTVTRSGGTVTGNLTSLAAGASASFKIRATVGN